MRYFLLIIAAYIFTFSACEQTTKVADKAKAFVPDSTKINKLDSLCNIRDRTPEGIDRQEKSLDINIYNELDNVKYLELDGELSRAIINVFPDSLPTRLVVYIEKGEIFFVRFRHWDQRNPSSKEVLSYLENGEIFYAAERSTRLAPGQPPTALYPVKLWHSTRSKEEIKAEYEKYWNPVYELIIKDRGK